MKHQASIPGKICLSLLFCVSFLSVQAQYEIPGETLIDYIIFGNETSERIHAFECENSRIITGALDQPARMLERPASRSETGSDLKFIVKVDPVFQNYFTLKFWGSDTAAVVSKVFINGKQIGYNRTSDYSPINGGFGDALPGRFYYCTIMLPLHMTQGKESAELIIRSQGNRRSRNRQFYTGYIHTNPYLDFSKEKQGAQPAYKVAGDISEEEKITLIQQYRDMQVNDFNAFSQKLDADTNAKISIVKYQDELRYYASALMAPWTPARTNEEKQKALYRIFQVIDNYVRDYYADFRLVTRGGHQGDWGGFLGALGEALYIVENNIFDDQILGKATFTEFLNQPLSIPLSDSEFALQSGGVLPRKTAWERALKANFDFARARLSYIFNQVYYTYEGAWKAHEGLRVIGSAFYEGKERSHQILREAWGIASFLGEEVLTDPDGRELDLYHSLFYHDQNMFLTDDFIYVVAKGLAKSKLDTSGNIVRRLPYGKYYTGVSENGMSRENGYVGNYGETMNYLPEWFYKTLDHKGDEALNDDILRLALFNLHARSYARYTSLNDDGNRIMRMQQVVDDRNMSYPGMITYAIRQSHGKAMHYASLEKYMADHPERYVSSDWNPYREYAAEAVGFVQQQLLDNQYFPNISSDALQKTIIDMRKYDYCFPETYRYVSSERANYNQLGKLAAGKVLPMTDLTAYSEEELKKLDIDKNDYKQFAWVDIDCMMACVKDGDKVLTGVFNYHNRGYSGCGRLHVQTANYDHIAQVATKAKFRYNEYYLRMNTLEMDFRSDIADVFREQPFALAGEICPVTYQPGIGKIIRENFNEDNPYSGFPDYLESQYGEYVFVFNTTRSQYGNEQMFEVKLPKQYKKKTILDLVSGKMQPVVKGKVLIKPNTAMVLKLDKNVYNDMIPDAVNFVTALSGNNKVVINWKPTSGAESYIVKRSFDENGKFEMISKDVKLPFFIDENIKNETRAYYKIVAVNKNGQSWDSYRAMIDLKISDLKTDHSIWRSDRIGDVKTGSATVESSKIIIHPTTGKGLGEGDDYMIHTRNIEDSFLFIHTVVNENSEISAKLNPNRAKMQGLMLRDQLSPDTRYIFLGCNEFGHIVFQNRTKNTQSEYTNHQVSPFRWPMLTQTIFEYPYLKLSRNADNHMITGYMSKNGKDWEKIADLFTPFPQTVYAGVCSAGTQGVSFEEVQLVQ